VVPGRDPRGRPHFWITTVPLEAPDEGTDRWAVEQGWISLTPLRLDLTDETALAAAVASSATSALAVDRQAPGRREVPGRA
jgi:5'-nucleotidase